jgi:hypothetical protein
VTVARADEDCDIKRPLISCGHLVRLLPLSCQGGPARLGGFFAGLRREILMNGNDATPV